MLRARLRQVSIRWKIVLITTATCAVVLGTCTAILVGSHLLLQRSDAKRQLTLLAEVSTLNMGAALANEDGSAVQEGLASLGVLPGIVSAGILSGGETLAQEHMAAEQPPYTPPQPHPSHGVQTVQGGFTVFAPIRHGRDLLGTLYIHYSLQGVYENIGHYAYMALGVALAGVGLACLLSAQLQRLATASLVRLNNTIQKISTRRDFSLRAHPSGDDEVGTLVDAFNHMLDLIQQRDAALQQHKENLEQEVGQRTEQLEANNQKLGKETEQRRQVVEELRRRIRIEKTISSVSRHFLAISAGQLPQAVEQALERVGTLAEAGLAFALTLSDEGLVNDVHSFREEDCRKSCSLAGTRLAEQLPWCLQQLRGGTVLLLSCPADLPEDAEQDRRFLEAGTIHALLCVPMVYQGRLIGVVGLASLNQARYWTEEEVHLIRLLGDIMLGALGRHWEEEKRNRLEEQVRQAQKLESLGVLSGGIAHDFNNLLMGILGNAELAGEETGNAEVIESLNNIRAGAKQASDLCRQMLAYSGRGRVVMQSVHTNQLLQALADLLRTSISKKARLELQLAEDLQPIRADVAQVRQVAMNLITNAAEAIGDLEGTIVLRTRMRHCSAKTLARTYLSEDLPEGDYVLMEVIDSGCGMDPKTQERMFDPFFTSKFTGRGLGLAAVLGIVRSHRAALDVTSSPGKGTRFAVYFPVDREVDFTRPPSTAAPLLEWQGEGTVLVAEDESAVRFTIKRMLEKLGLSVLEAQDGVAAVQLMQENKASVKLIVLDLNMPRMNGYEALCNIREFAPDVPVLLSSGYSEKESIQDFAELNLTGFIEKPYSMEELVATVRGVLEGAAAEG